MTTTRRGSRGAVAAVLAAMALAVAGCSSPPAPPQESPDPVVQGPTIAPDKAPAPVPVLPAVWPLTGVPGEPAARPALAVKIENTAVARPQTGLDQADVVWETIVEFDVSRFVAVFHSQVPAEVGPIRSVRPMDPAILSPMHGLLAFSGGQPGILDLVAASGVQMISHDAGAPGMYRARDRAAPHNVYGTPQTFWDQADADHQAPPGEQFTFARSADRAAAVVAGTPANVLSFRLAGIEPLVDLGPGERDVAALGGLLPGDGTDRGTASAVNVVSITAPHPNTGYAAQGGAPVPTYELVGSGEGVVATGGKTLPVRWQKDSESAPMRLFFADGRPADLAPGNTWVELVPAGTGSLTVG